MRNSSRSVVIAYRIRGSPKDYWPDPLLLQDPPMIVKSPLPRNTQEGAPMLACYKVREETLATMHLTISACSLLETVLLRIKIHRESIQKRHSSLLRRKFNVKPRPHRIRIIRLHVALNPSSTGDDEILRKLSVNRRAVTPLFGTTERHPHVFVERQRFGVDRG